MRMEHRAITRLLAAGDPLDTSRAPLDVERLLAPFDSPSDELRLATRPAVRAELAVAREAAAARGPAAQAAAALAPRGEHPEKAAWLAEHTAALEEGYAPGLVGDMLRRRYTWFRGPAADTDHVQPGEQGYLPPAIAPPVPGIDVEEGEPTSIPLLVENVGNAVEAVMKGPPGSGGWEIDAGFDIDDDDNTEAAYWARLADDAGAPGLFDPPSSV